MARKNKKNAGVSGPEGFPDKSWNLLDPEWRDAVQGKNTDDIEKDIIVAARSMSGSVFDMKNDPKVTTLQEDLKLLKSAYTEVINIDKAKLDYCIYLLNERGVPITKDAVSAANKAKKEADSDD
jgi:hypothetical protein